MAAKTTGAKKAAWTAEDVQNLVRTALAPVVDEMTEGWQGGPQQPIAFKTEPDPRRPGHQILHVAVGGKAFHVRVTEARDAA